MAVRWLLKAAWWIYLTDDWGWVGFREREEENLGPRRTLDADDDDDGGGGWFGHVGMRQSFLYDKCGTNLALDH